MAGWPVHYPHSCTMKPCCCNSCSMLGRIVLLKYASPSLKKMPSWWKHMLLYIVFSILGANILMRLWCQCFPKRISNFQLIWSQNSFSLCLTLSILNVFWPREDCSVSSLHDWALTCVSGWFGELCSQEWFVEVFLTSCSDFHDRIMSVFNAVPPEAWRSEASSIDSGPCSLLDFSTFTKSFHGFMYYWQTFWNWFKMCKFAIF